MEQHTWPLTAVLYTAVKMASTWCHSAAWNTGVQDGLPDHHDPASCSVAAWAPEGVEPTGGGDGNARFSGSLSGAEG